MNRQTEQSDEPRERRDEIEQETAETDAPVPSKDENENWWRGTEGHSEVH